MEKKLLLALFLWVFQCSISIVLANNGFVLNNEPTRPGVYCDAPAPDNFQVTSRGSDFIAVAWDPISTGVTYSLVVSVKENETWIPMNTFTQIAAPFLTIEDIGFNDEVLLSLAAECSTGERSIYVIELLPKIILELSVPGRNPVNPQVFQPCKNIKLGEHNWVGFSVKKHGGTELESNIFEVVVTGNINTSYIDIKRNSSQTVIYAVDDNNFFPPPTITNAPNPFKVSDISDPDLFDGIGRVSIKVTDVPEWSVNICQSPVPVWNTNYEFKVLTANLTVETSPESPKEHSDGSEGNKTSGKLKANSPFSEILLVFLEVENQLKEDAVISLLNIAGQIILEQQVVIPFDQIAIPTSSIPTGLYALQIKTSTQIRTIKVQKLD